MRFSFHIDSEVVEFFHDPVISNAELRNETGKVILQNALEGSFNLAKQAPTVTWRCNWRGHDVIVQRKRKFFFAMFRPMEYKIWVDGQYNCEAIG